MDEEEMDGEGMGYNGIDGHGMDEEGS